MTPNSLDSSTAFVTRMKPPLWPWALCTTNQATMDSDPIAAVVHQSGHLSVTRVLCLCYTPIG